MSPDLAKLFVALAIGAVSWVVVGKLFPYVLHIRRDEIHGWRWWLTHKDDE